MNKKIITMAAAGIAVIALTGAALADTTSTTDNNQKQHAMRSHHGPFQNKELLTFLNLDSVTLQKDLQAGQSLADIAQAQGKTESDVTNFLVEQATKRIDEGVASGKIPQDKADQMKTKLSDGIKRMVEQKGGFHPQKNFKNKGKENHFKVIASVTGIDQNEIMTKVKEGKSIAQIASEHNINEQDLIDKLLQKDKERITNMVNKTWQKHNHSQDTTNPNTTAQ